MARGQAARNRGEEDKGLLGQIKAASLARESRGEEDSISRIAGDPSGR